MKYLTWDKIYYIYCLQRIPMQIIKMYTLEMINITKLIN